MIRGQKGFGAIELVLVVVIVAIIGGFTWKVFQIRNENASSDTADVSETQNNEDLTDDGQGNDIEQEMRFEPPSDWVKHTNDKLGVEFYLPPNWVEKEFDHETEDIVFVGWQAGDVEIRLRAASVDQCPQGDGAPLSLFQGYYEKNGEYYKNWCPEEGLSKEYKVNEKDAVSTVSLGDALYSSGDSECDLFWCSEEEISNGSRVYNFISVFNVESPPFAGASFFYTYVGEAGDVVQVEKDIVDVFKTISKYD